MADDEVLEFSIEDLTLREIIEAERAMKKFSGRDVPFGEMFVKGKQPSGSAMAAVVYALKKRDDPEFTFDDALDVKIEQLSASEPDPTGAAG